MLWDMRILIATGIFRPEIGGPATFAFELGKRLSATGHAITLLTYSDKASYPADAELGFPIIRVVRGRSKIKNYFNYFKVAWREVKKNAIIYSLDWFSAGMPVALACKFAHKKYILRVGGGYIWEKYLSQGNPPVTLKDFYARGLQKRYPLMFWIIGRVLRRAERIIFNSDQQRELYNSVYGLDSNKTLTIYNAVPENRLSSLVQSYNSDDFERDKEIVFAGRFIKMKNIESLIKAFSGLDDKSFRLLLIGNGPLEPKLRNLVDELKILDRVRFFPAMSPSELYKRIAHAHVVVIPSWTDISPNQAYECLSLGIPILLTKENYLSINTYDFLKIDPASVDDIAEKLNMITKPEEYKEFVANLKKIKFYHPWSEVVGEHIRLFVNLNRNQL